jgi:hypothetical protein
MAKNVTKKNSLSIKAIVSVEDEKVMLEIEGYAEPTNLATFLEEFDGKDVTISVNTAEDLA